MPTYPSNRAQPMGAILKDSDAVLDYPFVWERWLQQGESIAFKNVTITPSGELMEDSSAIEADIQLTDVAPDGTKTAQSVRSRCCCLAEWWCGWQDIRCQLSHHD